MTFKKPIDGRTFLPDNIVEDTVSIVSDDVRSIRVADGETRSRAKQKPIASRSDYEATLAAYRKDQDFNRLMRQRHGVNM
jgi:hypothetical protein